MDSTRPDVQALEELNSLFFESLKESQELTEKECKVGKYLAQVEAAYDLLNRQLEKESSALDLTTKSLSDLVAVVNGKDRLNGELLVSRKKLNDAKQQKKDLTAQLTNEKETIEAICQEKESRCEGNFQSNVKEYEKSVLDSKAAVQQEVLQLTDTFKKLCRTKQITEDDENQKIEDFKNDLRRKLVDLKNKGTTQHANFEQKIKQRKKELDREMITHKKAWEEEEKQLKEEIEELEETNFELKEEYEEIIAGGDSKNRQARQRHTCDDESTGRAPIRNTLSNEENFNPYERLVGDRSARKGHVDSSTDNTRKLTRTRLVIPAEEFDFSDIDD